MCYRFILPWKVTTTLLITLLLFTFQLPHLSTIPHSQDLILRPNSHGQLVYHYTEDCKGDGK